MIKTTLAALIVMSLLFCPAIAQKKGDYSDPAGTYDEGWSTLFNGKDLTGWIPVLEVSKGEVKRYVDENAKNQSTFTASNGILKTTGTPLGYIRTEDVYDNFVFHVEVRFSELGNSGVLFHVQQDAPLPKSIECQLFYSRMGRVFPLRGSKLTGGEMIHYNARPVGEWNTIEVYSSEGRVATLVNGVLVGLGENAEPAIGYICLQSEGTAVEFRNIKVKRFSPAHHLRGAK